MLESCFEFLHSLLSVWREKRGVGMRGDWETETGIGMETDADMDMDTETVSKRRGMLSFGSSTEVALLPFWLNPNGMFHSDTLHSPNCHEFRCSR